MEVNVYRSAPASRRRFFFSEPTLKPPLQTALFVTALVALAVAMNQVHSRLVVLALVPFFASLYLIYGLGHRLVPIDVGPHGISIDSGRRGAFSIEDAALGLWFLPLYGCPAGLALHLVGRGGRRYRLGGCDHRPWRDAPIDASPIEAVDGRLSREDFAELLAAIDPGLAPVADSNSLRFPLVLNGASSVLRRLPFTPRTAVHVEIDASEIRVFDEPTGTWTASSPLGAVEIVRAAHQYNARFTMAAVILRAPGLGPLFIGVPDPRLKWRGAAPSHGKPVYQLGSPDWLALIELFGASAELEVSPD